MPPDASYRRATWAGATRLFPRPSFVVGYRAMPSLRTIVSAGLLASSALFCVNRADASDCTNPLVSTCINSDTYWPHAGPMRMQTVGSAETTDEGQVAFGLVTSYLSRPIVLKIASPGPGGSRQNVVDNQVNANFLWAYGVTRRLQLDFALPATVIQDGAGTSPITGGPTLRDTAVRDLRFGLAYSIIPRPRVDLETLANPRANPRATNNASGVYGLVTRFEVSAPTGDRDQFAGERTAVFVPSITGDYRRGRWFGGAELGWRVRPTTEFAGARIGQQFLFALGVGADILPKELLAVSAEAHALYNLPEQHDTAQTLAGLSSHPNGSHIVPAEWTLAARTAPLLAGDIAFSLGGGGAIPLGDAAITAPRFRFTLGIIYAPLGRDSDGDGVPDKQDRCPHDAQSERSYPPRDGCTHENPPEPEAGK